MKLYCDRFCTNRACKLNSIDGVKSYSTAEFENFKDTEKCIGFIDRQPSKNIIRLGPDDKLDEKELEAFKRYMDAAECAVDKGYTSEDITNIGLYLIRRNGKLYNWERIAETLYQLPDKEECDGQKTT